MASNDPNCLFCKIVAGTIPAERFYEDEQSIVLYDINRQAPVHMLIIPKQHIASLDDTSADDTSLLGHLMAVTADIARKQHLEHGYRVVINTGDDAGQSVHHLHVHLLGGRQMSWPPG